MHAHSDLSSLAAIVVVALVCGMIFARLRQPALVGYLLSGIVLGQSGLGLVETRDAINFLAELGVLLLLFLVGMELSLRSFRAIWGVALSAAALQIVCASAIMWVVGAALGLPFGVSVLFGFVVAVSSTAVAVRMLEQLNILRTAVGQLTAAILIAQDLAIVPMMLVLGQFSEGASLLSGLFKMALSVLLLGALVWWLSRRSMVRMPFAGQLAGSPELRPLYGLGFCFGAATLTGLMGLSAPYGAFLAGLVVGNSTIRRTLSRSVQSVQNVLIMVFFLSVGLLIDLRFVWAHIGTVLLILFVVIVVKTAFNIGILLLLREPWPHAFISGVLLAQIGEFSFVLGGVGLSNGLIDADGYQLVVTVTAFTLIVTPLWLISARRLLRIAVARTSSVAEVLARLRGGGVKAVLWAARAQPIPAALASRILGRPRHKSVLEALESDAYDDDADPAATEAATEAAAETSTEQAKRRRRPRKAAGTKAAEKGS